MRHVLTRMLFGLFLFLTLTFGVFAADTDVKGSQDHPLLTRMPGFYIANYEKNEFDDYSYKTDEGKVQVEGRKYVIDYRIKKGVTPPGNIQILRNYSNALAEIGAVVKFKSSYYNVFAITKNDMETWVKVGPENSDGNRYILTIVERTVMTQAVKADADAMAKGIAQTGHMALYGIYFDTAKATIKEESAPALQQVVELLKNNPSLNLYVVGHTDSEGGFDYNMDLSRKRAVAVVDTLVSQYKIHSTRLMAAGVGPLCPVASNRSPKGRAENRRVELVEK